MEERKYFLNAVRYVSSVQIVNEVFNPDELPPVTGFRPDIWAVSEASDTAQKQDYCRLNGIGFTTIREAELKKFPQPPTVKLPSLPVKKVLVTGCYDWFHSGHIRFFEETLEYGNLYVVVGSDKNVALLKGDGHPLFPEDERRYMVGSIRFVMQALISTGSGWMDAEPEIEKIQPDIYVVNEDGDKPEKLAFCKQHGLEYVVLKRTPAAGLPRRESTHLRGF